VREHHKQAHPVTPVRDPSEVDVVEPLLLLAIFLFVYGALVIVIAIFRPGSIWQMAKIQGFVKLMGETGTRVFFIIWAIAALVGGYFALINADL
jgi:uncharacterized membrane protein